MQHCSIIFGHAHTSMSIDATMGYKLSTLIQLRCRLTSFWQFRKCLAYLLMVRFGAHQQGASPTSTAKSDVSTRAGPFQTAFETSLGSLPMGTHVTMPGSISSISSSKDQSVSCRFYNGSSRMRLRIPMSSRMDLTPTPNPTRCLHWHRYCVD